jgi:hypothetical protein
MPAAFSFSRYRTFHQGARSQNCQPFVTMTLLFVGNLDRNVQPRARRPVLHEIESLVNCVDWSNQKICSRPGQLFRGRKHEFRDPRPVAGVDALHIIGEVMAVHRHFGMTVRAQQFRAFDADGAIAERCSFRAASDDADVERHGSGQLLPRSQIIQLPIVAVEAA